MLPGVLAHASLKCFINASCYDKHLRHSCVLWPFILPCPAYLVDTGIWKFIGLHTWQMNAEFTSFPFTHFFFFFLFSTWSILVTDIISCWESSTRKQGVAPFPSSIITTFCPCWIVVSLRIGLFAPVWGFYLSAVLLSFLLLLELLPYHT